MRILERWNKWRYDKALAKLPSEVAAFIAASLPNQGNYYSRRDLLPPTDYIKLVNEYAGWAYASAQKNARNVASVPLRLYRYLPRSKNSKVRSSVVTRTIGKQLKDRMFNNASLTRILTKAVDIEEVMEHPWLELQKNVNRDLNGFTLIELTVLFKQVTGNAYWLHPAGIMGIPQEIWILPSQYVGIVPDPDKYIKFYTYGTGRDREEYEPEITTHFKYPNIKSIYFGMGPLEAAFASVTLNEDFDEFERAMLDNGAVIPAIYSTEEPMGKAAAKRLRADIMKTHGGHKKAGKFGLFHSGLKQLPLSWNPKDINYAIGMKMTKEKIAGIFGVPLSKLTVEDVNRANAEAGNYSYMKDTITPECISIADMINQDIMPAYDEKLFVAFDNCVPEDKEFILKQQESRMTKGALTINEVRTIDGLDPVEGGDEPLVMNTMKPLSQVIKPPVIPGAFSQADEDEQIENEDENEDEGKYFGISKPEVTESYVRIPVRSCDITATITISRSQGIKALYCGKIKKVATYLFDKDKWTMAEARAWVRAHDDGKEYHCPECRNYRHFVINKQTEQAEAEMSRAVNDWMRATEIVVASHISEFTLQSIETSVPWWDVENGGKLKLLKPTQEILGMGAIEGQRHLRVAISFNIESPMAIQWAENYVGQRITLITNETREAIKNMVARGMRQGDHPFKTAQEIRKIIGLNQRQMNALNKYERELQIAKISEGRIKELIERERKHKLNYRSKMIARTESAAAFAEGELGAYKEAGTEMVRLLSQPEACDECLALAGEYLLVESYGILPIHPNCICDWIPVD